MVLLAPKAQQHQVCPWGVSGAASAAFAMIALALEHACQEPSSMCTEPKGEFPWRYTTRRCIDVMSFLFVSLRCMIKLQRERAQAAYNLLNGIVHEKFSLKVAHEV